LDRLSVTLCLPHYVTETSHLYSLRDFWRHFGLSRAAAHSDWCFFCAVYKYSYLLTYLSRLVRVTDLPGRLSLYCLLSSLLSTTGPFSSIWNNLPDSMTSIPTLSTFRQRLKTCLFSLSLPRHYTRPTVVSDVDLYCLHRSEIARLIDWLIVGALLTECVWQFDGWHCVAGESRRSAHEEGTAVLRQGHG